MKHLKILSGLVAVSTFCLSQHDTQWLGAFVLILFGAFAYYGFKLLKRIFMRPKFDRWRVEKQSIVQLAAGRAWRAPTAIRAYSLLPSHCKAILGMKA